MKSVWLDNIKGFLALAGFLFGPALIGLGAYAVSRSAGSDRWPTTPGTVIKSDVSVFGSGNSRRKSFVLEYEYEVKGQAYISNIIYFQTNTGKGHYYPPARSKDFPKGAAVKPYYNPAEPSIAVLEPGIPWRVSLALAIGILWTCWTIWLCFIQPRFFSEQSETDSVFSDAPPQSVE
ncbi:MAG: DUF3592 domain-containing protein [Planctomycetota bacterium]|jgi:hypothetical protein|nr:DUF3592 domain-containing protein [Planctomycetota bacterium]MDP6505065.1 DUF3592 domain-containing protein [Planctomycetota bacterium]